ncbi:MAG TPA: hypothetical protein VFT23_13510 [Burkholderiales bacterium]|nr:hypothetical protein [Burkholderiales bacterium]
MLKTEHLLFILPMIPTLLIIAAGAVSVADVALPARTPESTAMIAAEAVYPTPVVWNDWLAM